MKNSIIIILCFFVISIWGDESFSEAEKVFENGSFFEAEKILKEYITRHKNEKSKNVIRARAMLEYIARKNPDKIESILKKYQALSEMKNVDCATLLLEIPYGIMVLKMWKTDAVSEWIDLSQNLLLMLERAESKTPKSDALKIVYYRAEVLFLRGETRESAKFLEEAIAHYYSKKTPLEKMSAPDRFSAVSVYSLLGDVYTALAAQSDDRDEKLKYQTLAGTVWLKAYPAMEKNTVLQMETIQKLRNCDETLALLGRKLKLPAELLKNKRETYYPLIRKMLNEKRCSGAGKVIDSELTKKDLASIQKRELLSLKLFSLCGLKKYTECAMFLQKNSQLLPTTPESLVEYLKLSGQILNYGNQDDAYTCFSVLSAMPYQTSDLENILFQCANLAVKCDKIDKAKSFFEKAAELAENPILKQQALFQAAQCAERLDDHAEALRLADATMRLDVSGITQTHAQVLHLQSAIRLKEYALAASDAEILLARKNLDNMLRSNVLLLAAFTFEQQKETAKADQCLTSYLTENSETGNYFSVLSELKRIRLTDGIFAPLDALCKLAISSHNDAEETYRLILETGTFFCQKKQQENALKIFENLLNIKMLSPDKLISCSKILSGSEFEKNSPEANSVAQQLIAKHLPEFSNNPKVKELYFRLAELYFHTSDCAQAIHTLDKLLSEQKIYRAEEVLFLHGRILDKLENWQDSAKIWRRLLMTSRPENRLEVIHNLAFAEMQSGQFKQSVATAFLAILADGKRKKDERENRLILDCLDILLQSAKKANLMEDYNEALNIKEQMERK